MNRLFIILTILTIGCSTKKDRTDSSKKIDELKVSGHLGDEFKGDYLIYSGRVLFEDTTGLQGLAPPAFMELVMDTDKRFAIRTTFIESKIETDTMTFTLEGGQSNKGIGTWSDLGDKLELKFESGTVDSFFDEDRNKGGIEVLIITRFAWTRLLTRSG